MSVYFSKALVYIFSIGLISSAFATPKPQALAFDKNLSGYRIKVGNFQSEYTLMSFFYLPNETVDISVTQKKQALTFATENETGIVSAESAQYTLAIPATPGLYTYKIKPSGHTESKINIFVMHPHDAIKNKKLNGYTIGEYPKEAYKGLAIYNPPKGFVEVTKNNQDTWVSPHYQLKQFLCKQNQGYPKYVVLQTRLLRKLEFLTGAVNDLGIPNSGFTIMSGYRTPYYNALIKNKKYSRHQWGGAADIYIDQKPKDGIMDDLNKDGKITIDDAKVLWNLVEKFYKSDPEYKPMIGGLGLYKANSAHGPFVHIDVRGSRARW